MPLRGRSILVVEEEYLIALEMGNILEEYAIGAVDIVTDVATLTENGTDLRRYDAAIVEIRTLCEPITSVAARLIEFGVPVVFGTAFDEYQDGVPGFPNSPVVLKPYAADEFVAAVLAAIDSAANRH